MRNISDKVVEKIKPHFLLSISFSEKPAVYKTVWKNTAAPDRPRMAI
jgi:hypothetical protein